MNWAEAVQCLRAGQQVARRGWNDESRVFIEDDQMKINLGGRIRSWTFTVDDYCATDWLVWGAQ